MRKVLCLFLLAGLLAVPSMAFGADQLGVYVAPKFVYGLTQMNDVKLSASFEGVTGSLNTGDKVDNVFGGSIALGYDFGKNYGIPVRAELEYAMFSDAEATMDAGARAYMMEGNATHTFSVKTLFANAYWDFDTGTRLTPYVGAGLGLGFIGAKTRVAGQVDGLGLAVWSGTKTKTNFAWNIGAGLGYDITDNWTVDAGYRFVGLGSAKTETISVQGVKGQGKASDLYQHQLFLGMRYTF